MPWSSTWTKSRFASSCRLWVSSQAAEGQQVKVSQSAVVSEMAVWAGNHRQSSYYNNSSALFISCDFNKLPISFLSLSQPSPLLHSPSSYIPVINCSAQFPAFTVCAEQVDITDAQLLTSTRALCVKLSRILPPCMYPRSPVIFTKVFSFYCGSCSL